MKEVLWIMGLLKYNQHLKIIKIWWFCIESFITPLQSSFFFFLIRRRTISWKTVPQPEFGCSLLHASHMVLCHTLTSSTAITWSNPVGLPYTSSSRLSGSWWGCQLDFCFLVPEDSPASAILCKGVSYTGVSSVGKAKRGRCLDCEEHLM